MPLLIGGIVLGQFELCLEERFLFFYSYSKCRGGGCDSQEKSLLILATFHVGFLADKKCDSGTVLSCRHLRKEIRI